MNEPQQLSALAALGADHRPRTRHLDRDGRPRFTNALIHETSPYLLQHAHNPVDWRSWGEAAFAEATRRQVPVFLSVGYSTCHWCHVMEHESFEDEEIAEHLNAHFVPVKVDREERPDVDAVFMEFVQRTTGRGGWPMSVWLTPEQRPLFGGTYFPARTGDRGPHPGFLQILEGIGRSWRLPQFQAQAEPALRAIGESGAAAERLPGVEVLDAAGAIFTERFDPEWGGFGGAPKFPRPSVLEFLLRQWRRSGDAALLEAVTTTLRRMYLGGLYDHVGGGFARYSVDARWRVPHFEKMLYDNAQLVSAYLQGLRATGEPLFARVVHEVLAYLQREMVDAEGGFFSATDADSPDEDGQGREGLFFTWTLEELRAALPADEAEWVIDTFGVTELGNFEGRSVLHLEAPLGERDQARWETLRQRLYARRSKRPAPGLDDKVLCAWNGLTIGAFAQAGWILDEPAYTARARAGAEFILSEMRDAKTGRLFRSWRRGRARHPAVLEDYAVLVQALLDLVEATGEARWLGEARAVYATMSTHFADAAGGFFRTPADGERLLFREKPEQDGAEPSGNAQAALAAIRLAEITGEARYRDDAEDTVRALAGIISHAPHAAPKLLCALDWLHDESRQIIVVTEGAERPRAMVCAVARAFQPNAVLLVGEAHGPLAAAVPAFAERIAQAGPTAYHCLGTQCDLPTTDADRLAELLA